MKGEEETEEEKDNVYERGKRRKKNGKKGDGIVC